MLVGGEALADINPAANQAVSQGTRCLIKPFIELKTHSLGQKMIYKFINISDHQLISL